MSILLKLIFSALLSISVLFAYSVNNSAYLAGDSDSIKSNSVSDSIYTFPDILIQDEEETILKLSSTFKDSLHLLYLIPKVYCMPMVQREMSYINQTADGIGLDKVIVITSFSSHRGYISFKRSNCPRLSCYNIEPDNYNVISPMILILNKDLVIIKGGFTQKQEPQKTIEFLKNISEYLFGMENIKIEILK
jgi:hypothetical protein